jgi:hypothetical protein
LLEGKGTADHLEINRDALFLPITIAHGLWAFATTQLGWQCELTVFFAAGLGLGQGTNGGFG